MSSEIAISARGLGKVFRVYNRPSSRLKQSIFPRLQSLVGAKTGQYFSEFQALNNIDFQVQKGSAFAVLGPNGCGKSTVLQILAGVLQPTSGSFKVDGKVAALLELGAGFNPDFTGRENIELNSHIMGLSKDFVSEKIDDIIEFSGIGEAVDQAVRTYSSGMFARLAFAVAINIRPDILIVDEALAVGDSGFQMKCMLSMKEFKSAGGTIIFVSHDTSAVLSLCDQAIVLCEGEIVSTSSAPLECVKLYEKLTRNTHLVRSDHNNHSRRDIEVIPSTSYSHEFENMSETRVGTGDAYIVSVDYFDQNGDVVKHIHCNDTLCVRVTVFSKFEFSRVVSGMTLKNANGFDAWGDNSDFAGIRIKLKPGLNFIDYTFCAALTPGPYYLFTGIADVSGARVDLDQRWPVRKLRVYGERQMVGMAYAPAEIKFGSLS